MCCIHKRNPTITGSLVGPFAEQVDQSLGEFAGYFDKALQLPSGFLKLLIRLQELPAVVLSEKMADSMKESDGRSSLTSKRVSRSRIESTRQQKYASHMESLPRPRRCSRDYKSCIPVSRNLFRTCSEEGPIWHVTKGNSFVISGGSINKENEDKRIEREMRGESPKDLSCWNWCSTVRFIHPTRLLLRSACQSRCVGARRGMEVIGHLSRTLFGKGYAIVKMEAMGSKRLNGRACRAVQKRYHHCWSYSRNFIVDPRPRCVCVWFCVVGGSIYCGACFVDAPKKRIGMLLRLTRGGEGISFQEGARIGCKLGASYVQDLYEPKMQHRDAHWNKQRDHYLDIWRSGTKREGASQQR